MNPLRVNYLNLLHETKNVGGFMISEAARKRLFDRVYVCGKCKAKMRADGFKVRAGKVKCRKCGSKELRPKSKESRR